MTEEEKVSDEKNFSIENRVKEALEMHGFPLQITVHRALENRGWKSQAESAFVDSDLDKIRRVDFIAWKKIEIDSKFYDDVVVTLVIECKRRANSSWVFYKTERDSICLDDTEKLINYSQHIALITAESEWLEGFSDSAIKKVLTKSHQLPSRHPQLAISGHDIPIETEQQRKKRIIEQKSGARGRKNTNNRLDFLHIACLEVTKALEWSFNDEVAFWRDTNQRPRSFSVYYPVIVFDGSMFEVTSSDDMEVKKIEYLQLRWETRAGYHIIDVMTKQYFEEYLELIERELEDLKQGVESLITPFAELRSKIGKILNRNKSE